MKGANINVTGRARPRLHWIGFALLLWLFAVRIIEVIAADDAPAPLVEAKPPSVTELAESVELITADNAVSEKVPRLIAIDSSLNTRQWAGARELQGRIIEVLAQSGDQRGVAYVRSVFEDNADRRNDAAYALSLCPRADLADWRFMIRSLTVVEGQQAVSVLKTLTRFGQRATKPEWLRHVLLIGLRLEGEDQRHAVRLLEHWTGRHFGPGDQPPAKSLAAFQAWFREKYPNEPDPVLPVDPPDRRWKYAELRSQLERADGKELGDVAQGREVFQKAQCSKCHRKGEFGERLGPDLTTLGWRRQRKEILEAVLYPSHELDEEYPNVSVVTSDGKVLTGMMAAGPRDTVVIMQYDGQMQSLPRKSVEEIRTSRVSNMPENLLETLSLREIKDLFAFLVAGESETQP
jgi:putative heme-binding domain-containing protein